MSPDSPEPAAAGGGSGVCPRPRSSVGASATARYRRADIVRLEPCGAGVYVYIRDAGSCSLVPAPLVRLLERCGTFKTIDEHTSLCGSAALRPSTPRIQDRLLARLANLASGERPDDRSVREGLLWLVDAGLMISEDEVRERFSTLAAEAGDSPSISSIVVPTRNRPNLLAATLFSFAGNATAHRRSVSFGVADSSDEPRFIDQNRRTVALLKDRFGVRAWHTGPEEVARLADELTRSGCAPPEVARFCFSGFGKDAGELGALSGPGAARNVALLCSVGEAVATTDDDMACKLARLPGAACSLVFSSEPDPTDFFFFPSREAACCYPDFEDTDFLAIHEQLLGRCVASLSRMATEAGPPVLDDASPRLLRRLVKGEGRIVATALGVVGDCGMQSTAGYLFVEGDSFDRLTRSESDYQAALRSGAVLRGVNAPTVGDTAFFMAGNVALDNRALLPPFLPLQGNEDATFGATLRVCFDAGYVGFPPWALVHSPPMRTRPPFPTQIQGLGSFAACDVLRALVCAFGPCPDGADPAKRMRELGMFLQAIGSARPHRFQEFVHVQVCRVVTARLAMLERRLKETGGKPEFWARDARRCVGVLMDAATEARLALPGDLVARYGEEGAVRLSQQTAVMFGKLLYHWPDMVRGALQLRRQGASALGQTRRD